MCVCVSVGISLCVELSIQKCPVTAVTPMVPTLISLFPLISCCRLGTAENGSSACRDFRLFSERFSWRDMVASCCTLRVSPWPLHWLAGTNAAVCGARPLVWDSSESTDEPLLGSGGGSLVGHVERREETSSTEGGRAGRGEGSGRGGGGGGSGGRERQGRKPLHLGAPFVRGAGGWPSFSKSTLSSDLDFRFFCRENSKMKRNFQSKKG